MQMKIEKIITFVICVFCIQFTYSQVSPELQKKWDKESSKPENPLLQQLPSHLPDRVIITPLELDNNSLAITWRTDTTVKEGSVEIIEGDAYRFPKDNRKRKKSTYNVVEYKDYPMYYHTVTITDLIPDKTYKYRVGNSPFWSPWYTYKHQNFTDTVSVLYFGDVQNGIFDHSGRIFSEALKKFNDAKLAVYVGDLINHANNDYEWSEWHTATQNINSSIPVIATPGNHEYLKNLEGRKVQLSSYWVNTFPFPYEWDAGQFYLDYGFVRFVVMNSNDNIYEQGKWLDQVLSETTQDWVVIVSHHPVFSGAKNRGNKGLLENWLPIIKKYRHKIGLVLQGHDHTYARGGLEDRTGTVENPNHPVFTVTVVGDKYYELEEQRWMDVSYNEVSTYQYIQITKNKIHYQSFSETNTLVDEFVITK